MEKSSKLLFYIQQSIYESSIKLQHRGLQAQNDSRGLQSTDGRPRTEKISSGQLLVTKGCNLGSGIVREQASKIHKTYHLGCNRLWL